MSEQSSACSVSTPVAEVYVADRGVPGIHVLGGIREGNPTTHNWRAFLPPGTKLYLGPVVNPPMPVPSSALIKDAVAESLRLILLARDAAFTGPRADEAYQDLADAVLSKIRSNMQALLPLPATIQPADGNGPEYQRVLEWDRPGVGAYDDGSTRIITSRRRSDGTIGACHKASDEETRWVRLMEAALLGQDPSKAIKLY
jgi:hypothetical protein